MAGKVFLFTAGTSPNWDKTIGRPIDVSSIRTVLPASVVDQLEAKASGGKIHAWGAPSGAIGTIAGMEDDDVVFGSRRAHIEFGGLIALSLKEPSDVLSRRLWGGPDWPYVYFLYQARFGSMPVPDFLTAIGERGDSIRGFRVSHRASRMLQEADSPGALISQLLGIAAEIETKPPEATPAEEQTTNVGRNAVDESGHAEAEADLIRIGRALGLQVWVASNDRHETVRDLVFRDHTLAELPFKGEPEFHRQIKLIDVIWLQGPAIRAAFEVEHSTSVYSGILRMGDLVAQFPNVSFPIYVVAPDADRKHVCSQMSRPAFRKLAEICRYIPYSRLHDAVGDVLRLGKHLLPDVISEYSEACDDK